MESKKEYNIFNIAVETIIKWFDQTHSTMTIALKNSRQLDIELMGVLLTARKQTIGALTTLANNHFLPTHVFLRDYYGWQTKAMQKEYEELKLELTKK